MLMCVYTGLHMHVGMCTCVHVCCVCTGLCVHAGVYTCVHACVVCTSVLLLGLAPLLPQHCVVPCRLEGESQSHPL